MFRNPPAAASHRLSLLAACGKGSGLASAPRCIRARALITSRRRVRLVLSLTCFSKLTVMMWARSC